MYLPEEEHSYGRPNRPGTPVGDVISNFYGDIASKVLTQKYDILQETQKPMSLKFARGHTKASTLAHHLRFLASGGLIRQEKRGRTVINRADYEHMRTLATYLLSECCADAPCADSHCRGLFS